MENPIQSLELYADGSTKLLIRNQAGRGHRWREEPTCDLESACQRFLTLVRWVMFSCWQWAAATKWWGPSLCVGG